MGVIFLSPEVRRLRNEKESSSSSRYWPYEPNGCSSREKEEKSRQKVSQGCLLMSRKDTKTNGIEPYIIDCMAMNLHEDQALEYLDKNGYDISRAEYYRIKNEIKESSQERLNLIASKEFLIQHLDRIDTLRTILKEMWANYHQEKNPTKRVQILEKIEENQIYLSSYYDSTRYVLQQQALVRKKKQLEQQEH